MFSVKVPRRDLDVISAEEAARIVGELPKFKKLIGDRPIVSFNYHSSPGCDARIGFSVHSNNRKRKMEIQNKIEC